jgi:hypothetical protein
MMRDRLLFAVMPYFIAGRAAEEGVGLAMKPARV